MIIFKKKHYQMRIYFVTNSCSFSKLSFGNILEALLKNMPLTGRFASGTIKKNLDSSIAVKSGSRPVDATASFI